MWHNDLVGVLDQPLTGAANKGPGCGDSRNLGRKGVSIAMKRFVQAFGLGMIITVGLAAVVSAVGETSQDAPQLRVAEHDGLGEYLVDGEGRTLYVYLQDEEEDLSPFTSTCYGDCAEAWPPLLTEAWPLPDESFGEGVKEDMALTSERDDGSLQITYNDWPLYYFAQDEEPGDVLGQGVGDNWFVISPQGEVVRDLEPVVEALELPHSWSGGEEETTESFAASGAWEIVLGAWCFEGTSQVTVVAYNLDGEEVGQVTVLGEGIRSTVLETEPGEYYLEVTSPTMHDYHWEIEVSPVAAE